MTTKSSLLWWQKGVIYQIVTPSFKDSDGNGMGDLAGITDKLDYIKWLGAGSIWLTPIYPSPMIDLGYDVADYTKVNKIFGSLESFDSLLNAAHEKGIKLILDWVPNHTSDQHPWFLESRSSKNNQKRDWYIWHDGKKDGSPPTNWLSVFGGSAWEWDKTTEQYYYHSFLDSQPDLNLRNPEVLNAVSDAMRFWLKRGVDGFRIDAASWFIKDSQYRNNPPNANYHPERDGPDQVVVPKYTWGRPEIHDVLVKLRKVVDEFDDRMLMGELVLPIDKLTTYYGEKQKELHLPMNMHLIWEGWNAKKIGDLLKDYISGLPENAWPTFTLSTHDYARITNRLKGDQARVAAMLLMTLGGTPTLYYGEEIGMKGVAIPPEKAIDPQGKRTGRNRDPSRTPMQWNESSKSGFTDGEPWLPVGKDVKTTNVKTQKSSSKSLLMLYRHLIELRKKHRALLSGNLEIVSKKHPILAYRRTGDDGKKFLVVLNMGRSKQVFTMNDTGQKIFLSTYLDRAGEQIKNFVKIRGDEGLILTQD